MAGIILSARLLMSDIPTVQQGGTMLHYPWHYPPSLAESHWRNRLRVGMPLLQGERGRTVICTVTLLMLMASSLLKRVWCQRV
jgi:hypothetical protein